MKNLVDKLMAYAELARVTNVPTVVSNALAGAALGVVAIDPTPAPPWREIGLTAYGVSLLYVGGMIMNGVVDRAEDGEKRPERPIPSGRVSVLEGWMLAGGAIAVGAAAVIVANVQTWLLCSVLIACIFGYNLWRPSGRRSLVLMGACRAVVYPLAAIGAGANRWAIGAAFGVGVVMGVYTVVLSVVARDEADEPKPQPIAWALPWLAVVAAAVAAVAGRSYDSIGLIILAFAAMTWLGGAAKAGAKDPPNPMASVLAALSGFCLVDALVMVAIDMSDFAVLSMGCFAVTIAGHRRLAGT